MFIVRASATSRSRPITRAHGTVRRAVVDGLRRPPDAEETRTAMALWATAWTRAVMVAPATSDLGGDGAEHKADFERFLSEVLPLLARMTLEEREALVGALTNPAVLAALPAMVRLGEGQPMDPPNVEHSERWHAPAPVRVHSRGAPILIKDLSPSRAGVALVGPQS